VTYPDRCCLVYHTHVCCLLSFLMTPVADAKQCTIHEELVRHLKAILLPKQADLITKFLHQADSFKVILKAMVQFLLNTGRIKVCSSQNVSHSFSLTGHVKMCNFQTLPPIVPPSQNMSRKDCHVFCQALELTHVLSGGRTDTCPVRRKD
ncbi:hypothetical protein LSAT2_011065, partial [Lamellibrachia satsuma]